MVVRDRAKAMINGTLHHVNLKIVRSYVSDDPAKRTFLPARETLKQAHAAHLPLIDFIDRFSAEPGSTRAAANEIIGRIDPDTPITRVCEIGPGTGRYTELLINAFHPYAYEIYETAADWVEYLRKTYNVVVRTCDGRHLTETADASIDLVHAEKVFVYLPMITMIGYLREMARVARPGGYIAFDAVTDRCIDDELIERWSSGDNTLYTMTDRAWLIDYLDRLGAGYIGGTRVPLSGASTELMVFRKAIPKLQA